ncbi:MAG: hypothetical protein ACLVB5_11900 [Christensenellales bacterium]
MKDKKLLFDRSCHVLYSRLCKKEIQAKIALHYPKAERETVWEKRCSGSMRPSCPTGAPIWAAKNFHNGIGAPTTASLS